MADTESPSDEERAKFFLNHSIDHIGYMDTLGDLDGDTAEQNLRCLEIDFSEGVQRVMRNKREHGFGPIKAWDYAVSDNWPEWVKVSLAESEHQIFEGDPEFMSDEEENYLTFLEAEYDVPR